MESKFKAIIDSENPVLVNFYAEWCSPSKILKPVLEQLKSKFGDNIKIVKIDVDKNPLLASNFQIKGVPTMLLFKNGMQIWRQSGVLEMNDLVKVIKSN